MIIKTAINTINLVYSASLVTEFDVQETRYFKAYGEPSFDVTGVIPYDAGDPPPPQDLAFNLEQDIGPAGVGGAATFNTASQNWEITAAGVIGADQATISGFNKGYSDVVADVVVETQLDFIDALPALGTAGDYLVGLCVLPGTDASPDLAGLFFGWGEYGGERGIWAFEKETGENGTILGSLVTRSTPNGVYLRVTRESADLTLSYSLNDGQTWQDFDATTLDAVAPRIGLFTSSGDAAATVTALFSKIRSQTIPTDIAGTFSILGGPTRRLIRSQSPHTFQLDGKVDPEASVKVAGWIEEMKARLEVAKDSVMGLPDPGSGPSVSYTKA